MIINNKPPPQSRVKGSGRQQPKAAGVQRALPLASKAASDDALELAKVGGDVYGNTVIRHPLPYFNADGGDF